jgi:D-alanine-D-alanine ligase-like ATP-grasp enzyme
MKKPIILIINRWNDELACYEQYIDHNIHDVIYITKPCGLEKIKTDLAKAVYVTDDLDHCALENKLDDFLFKNVPIHKIIAFSEVDQELAAFLRTKWSVTGMDVNEVKKFRNKVEMKQVAQDASIKVPSFCDLNTLSETLSETLSKILCPIKEEINYPVILKPKKGVSSEGIYKVDTEDQFKLLISAIEKNNYECEQFIEGTIYHADGLVQNGDMLICKISEYINTCFAYTHGSPLGSVIIDDNEFVVRATKFTQKVIDAFSLKNGAFHLEFIIDKNNELYFLEVGARIGGAQVPYVFKNIYDIDLFKEWVNIQLGYPVSIISDSTAKQAIGGWLLFPQPANIPCIVECCLPLKESIPFILFEKLPNLGHIFHGNGEYRDVSGIYLFEAPSTKEIKRAITQTINHFYIQTKPYKGEQ